MSTTWVLGDTIAALATAAGPAGLAVIRVSGPDAVRVAGAVFRGKCALAEAPSHTVHHGWAIEASESGPETRIDEIVAAVFRAPRSYTREDVVELSCHGGDQSSSRLLQALRAAGARDARPGEFTLRAFLNGRIDLAQAEAVADLIHASTERAQAVALSQLAGSLSKRLLEMTNAIADAAAEVEARVDFAEDVGGVEVPEHVRAVIAKRSEELEQWLAAGPYARAVREGARVPIVGRPNVGKSSLFNALVGDARAIVTAIPGTTRDRVSESIELHGIRVALSDTAGLRDTEDTIEALGILRSEEAIASAMVTVWVVDGSKPVTHEDRAIAERLGGRSALMVINKSDLAPAFDLDQARSLLPENGCVVTRASAQSGDGIADVKAELGRLLGASPSGVAVEPVGNPRQLEALSRARESLERAASVARDGSPGEIVALELRECLSAIGEVTGQSVGEDLLDRIFHRFCIGK